MNHLAKVLIFAQRSYNGIILNPGHSPMIYILGIPQVYEIQGHTQNAISNSPSFPSNLKCSVPFSISCDSFIGETDFYFIFSKFSKFPGFFLTGNYFCYIPCAVIKCAKKSFYLYKAMSYKGLISSRKLLMISRKIVITLSRDPTLFYEVSGPWLF